MKPTLFCANDSAFKRTAVQSGDARKKYGSPPGLSEGNTMIVAVACLPDIVGCVDDLLKRFNGHMDPIPMNKG